MCNQILTREPNLFQKQRSFRAPPCCKEDPPEIIRGLRSDSAKQFWARTLEAAKAASCRQEELDTFLRKSVRPELKNTTKLVPLVFARMNSRSEFFQAWRQQMQHETGLSAELQSIKARQCSLRQSRISTLEAALKHELQNLRRRMERLRGQETAARQVAAGNVMRKRCQIGHLELLRDVNHRAKMRARAGSWAVVGGTVGSDVVLMRLGMW